MMERLSLLHFFMSIRCFLEKIIDSLLKLRYHMPNRPAQSCKAWGTRLSPKLSLFTFLIVSFITILYIINDT